MSSHSNHLIESPPYAPDGINSFYGRTHSVHHAQYVRHDLRQVHPPTMHLDNALLATGLEEYLTNGMIRTPSRSKPYGEPSLPYVKPMDDGTISPLELPSRLLSFGTTDGNTSRSVLLDTEVTLDLDELDRRLESIAFVDQLEEEKLSELDRWRDSLARLERLEKTGLLKAFFACVNN